VDRDLASRVLVEIDPDMVTAETAYWLVSSEGADHRPDLLGFKRWLLREADAFKATAPAAENALLG
jgi:LysR family glycine cleavage system transcriptional activator